MSGSWTATTLPTEGDAARQDVVADSEGNAVTAWLDSAGVQASGFDGVGPRFTAFGAPSAGTIGQALSFAATADDAWSPPATDGKGSFRTTGRHAAATVRGTRWLVEDRCDGTLVRVRRGRVEVRDLRRARSVLVRAGHNYLARPR